MFSVLQDIIVEQATCDHSGNTWGTKKLNEVNEMRARLDKAESNVSKKMPTKR